MPMAWNNAFNSQETFDFATNAWFKKLFQYVDAPVCRVDLNGTNQTPTGGADTVVSFVYTAGSTSAIDTHLIWDNTNFRFMPRAFRIPGYYEVYFQVLMQTPSGAWAANTQTDIWIRKNGTKVSHAQSSNGAATTDQYTVTVGDLIYLNGTTDYIDFMVNSPLTNTAANPRIAGTVIDTFANIAWQHGG